MNPGLAAARYAGVLASTPWLGDALTDLEQTGLDACTLNNALNIAQLIVLVALLKWVRTERDS